jgi:biotin transport system substrate-specific component
LQGGLGLWTHGFSTLAGPTAGFIYGFLPAAFFAGWMMESGMARGFITTFMTAVLSTLIVFACGVFWLQAMIGWHDAYLYGVQPFLIVEPIKLIVASAFFIACQKRAANKHGN